MPSVGIGSGFCPPFRCGPIRPRNDFQQMAVRIVEIKTAATIEVVDLPTPITVKIRVESNAGAFDAGERGIEFALADEEGVVLSAELGGVGVVERYPVAGADRDEMRPLRSCLQSEDVGEE